MMISKKLALSAVKNCDGGIESIKGFLNRTFATTSWVSVENRYAGTKMKFLLGIHLLTGETSSHALIEVKYGLLEPGKWSVMPNQWRHIDRATWLKFFDLFIENDDPVSSLNWDRLEQCRKMKYWMTTLPDGKTPAFNCDLDMNVGKLNRIISECLVFQFLDVWQVLFPIFILYGDRISTAKELIDIASALSSINDVAYNIKYDRYGIKRQEFIEKLSKLETALKAKEDALSKKLEESADALNLLSEKYGIEIDIDEHCCSKPNLGVM